METKILNPETGRNVSISGKTGKYLISNYTMEQLAGASDCVNIKKKKDCCNHDDCSWNKKFKPPQPKCRKITSRSKNNKRGDCKLKSKSPKHSSEHSSVESSHHSSASLSDVHENVPIKKTLRKLIIKVPKAKGKVARKSKKVEKHTKGLDILSKAVSVVEKQTHSDDHSEDHSDDLNVKCMEHLLKEGFLYENGNFIHPEQVKDKSEITKKTKQAKKIKKQVKKYDLLCNPIKDQESCCGLDECAFHPNFKDPQPKCRRKHSRSTKKRGVC